MTPALARMFAASVRSARAQQQISAVAHCNAIGRFWRSFSAQATQPLQEVTLRDGQLKLVCATSNHRAAPPPSMHFADKSDHVGVVRSVFHPSGLEPEPLTKVVVPMGEKVGVASFATQPAGKRVVDKYECVGPSASGGFEYKLTESGTHLLEFLQRAGLDLQFLPDWANHTHALSPRPQSTNEVLMVAPTAFEFNDQAAQDNYFQNAPDTTSDERKLEIRRKVLADYAALHTTLTGAGVTVRLFGHEEDHATPDAVFPNNWFSTHTQSSPSKLVLYPMKVPNRQLERRRDLIDFIQSSGKYTELVDLSGEEGRGAAARFLEGTGSLVLDHIDRVAYVCLSQRSDADLAAEWARAVGFDKVVACTATDEGGRLIYHTNVVMAIGTTWAVVCADTVACPTERKQLLDSLAANKEVVEITHEQMNSFCGNIIEVRDGYNMPVIALSTQAYNAFTPEQRATLLRHVSALHHAPIETLEELGGGGVRCAIAELF